MGFIAKSFVDFQLAQLAEVSRIAPAAFAFSANCVLPSLTGVGLSCFGPFCDLICVSIRPLAPAALRTPVHPVRIQEGPPIGGAMRNATSFTQQRLSSIELAITGSENVHV